MINIEISEKSIKKALSNLSAYDAKVQKGVKDQVALSALTIETEAKLLVPVDTGRLKTSINSQITELGAIVGTNVEYAPIVEFGSEKGSAQPFLFPSFEGERINFVTSCVKILKIEK